MRRVSVWAGILLIPALGLMTGCGGDSGGKHTEPAGKPTRSGPSAKAPRIRAPRGINVSLANAARNKVIKICRTRAKGGRAARDPKLIDDLGLATRTMLGQFKANPDAPFRRSVRGPRASMRERLRSSGGIARHRCGGGAAIMLGRQLHKAAYAPRP